MATKLKSNPYGNRGLGRRWLIVVKALIILLLAMQPSLGGGDGDDGDDGGGCSGSTKNYSKEVYDDYKDEAIDLPVAGYSETLNGNDYISQLLGGASNRFDPRLPGYSYFQGVLQADNHITIAGQVRVVGGIMGADREDATGNLYSGAMITTNAHAFLGAGEALDGGPPGVRTRIRDMEEIPNPGE